MGYIWVEMGMGFEQVQNILHEILRESIKIIFERD